VENVYLGVNIADRGEGDGVPFLSVESWNISRGGGLIPSSSRCQYCDPPLYKNIMRLVPVPGAISAPWWWWSLVGACESYFRNISEALVNKGRGGAGYPWGGGRRKDMKCSVAMGCGSIAFTAGEYLNL